MTNAGPRAAQLRLEALDKRVGQLASAPTAFAKGTGILDDASRLRGPYPGSGSGGGRKLPNDGSRLPQQLEANRGGAKPITGLKFGGEHISGRLDKKRPARKVLHLDPVFITDFDGILGQNLLAGFVVTVIFLGIALGLPVLLAMF